MLLRGKFKMYVRKKCFTFLHLILMIQHLVLRDWNTNIYLIFRVVKAPQEVSILTLLTLSHLKHF